MSDNFSVKRAVSTVYARTATQVVAASDSKDTTNADHFCDGTNDEVQIIAAIDALPATGGSVLLMDGTYEIAAEITMNKANVKLIGQGKSTILNISSAIKTVNISAHFCEVNSIQFTGAKTLNFYGVFSENVDYGKVINCWFATLYYGIYTQLGDHWIYSHNTLTGAFNKAIRANGNSVLIEGNMIEADTDVIIESLGRSAQVIGNSLSGRMDIGSSEAITVGTRSVVSGNSIRITNGRGYTSTANGITIIGNVFETAGIALFNNGGEYVTITGNYFELNGSQSILNDGNNCTISSNIFFDTRSNDAPIHIRSDHNTIIGNTINKADRNGIKLSNSANHNLIDGNNIHDTSEDTDNTYDAILITGTSTYNIISNNRISGNAANKHRYGISEASSADDFNVYVGNIITDSQTAAFNINGASSTIISTVDGAVAIGAEPQTNVGADNLQLEGGVLVLKETTTPTADTNYGKIYTKSDNELYFQDGAGTEHLLHGDAFSNIWFHNPIHGITPVTVTISTQNAFTKIDSFTVVGKEDDLGHCVGSSANNEIALNADAGGEYEVSYHASITATGGADKEMVTCMGIELATALDITNVTDDTITPIVITSTAHGLENGDMVEIVGVLVNTAANGSFIVNSKTDDTFVIVKLDGTATTGNGDYDQGTPTGDVTIKYVGNMVVHREVRGATLGAISATGVHDVANSDKLAVYVANLDGITDLTIAAISFDCFRIGD